MLKTMWVQEITLNKFLFRGFHVSKFTWSKDDVWKRTGQLYGNAVETDHSEFRPDKSGLKKTMLLIEFELKVYTPTIPCATPDP